MASKPDLNGARGRLTDFCFCMVLLSYPVLSFLWRRSYPLLSLEVLWLFAAIVIVSLILSFLFARVGALVSYLLTATLVLLSFMVQFNFSLVGMIGCLVATTVLWLMSRQRFRANALLILLAMLAGAWLDSKYEPYPDRSQENSALVDTGLAPVVHILLDGFIGPGGLPDYPASALIRERILSFFEANDFQLYSHAYSRYFRTGESLPALMNYRHDFDDTFAMERVLGAEHILHENALFDAAQGLGYRFNIYQTGHIDLCQSNPDSLDRCWQYDHPNVHSGLSSGDVTLRFRILLKTLLQQSSLLLGLTADVDWLSHVEVAVHDPRVFDTLARDLQAHAPGRYFFAHALIPHSPFIYRADCSPSYAQHPALRVGRSRDERVLADEVYEIRNGLYFGQIDCALDNLQALIATLKKSGIYDRAIIIVHGDHGSGIAPHEIVVENLQLLDKEHYRAGYSTLFAVKYPGSTHTINDSVLPLSYLLEEFMRALPSYTRTADHYPTFSPSFEASPEKLDTYIYLPGEKGVSRVSINIFQD